MADATPPGTPHSPRPPAARNELGTTVIEDPVVAKVAGIAAAQVGGVYALGGTMARAFGAIRDAFNQSDQGQGISVEVGERQVAVDITMVAEYPMPLQEVAGAVRAAVVDAIQTIVGMEVTEVNITVQDVHLPDGDGGEDASKPDGRQAAAGRDDTAKAGRVQ